MDLPARPVDHLHTVAGEVDEHPIARHVHLAQRRLQPADPLAIQIAEPGVAEPIQAARAAAILLPEQRQRHVRPTQLAVHHSPVRNRTLVRRNSGRRRIQQHLKLVVIQPLGQRPPQPSAASPCHLAMHGSLA